MEKAGDFLGGALRMMKRPEAALAWLTGAWPAIVGQTLAAHTRPLRCKDGVLEIAADAKAWENQIAAMTGQFSARINDSWGRTLVCEVKIVASHPSPRRASPAEDNSHTPFVRRKRV